MRDVLALARMDSTIARSENIVLDVVESIVKFGLQEAIAVAQDMLQSVVSVAEFEGRNRTKLTLMLSGCEILTSSGERRTKSPCFLWRSYTA